MRETRAALVAHVGGKPSAVQAAMIERACQLTLRIARVTSALIVSLSRLIDSHTWDVPVWLLPR